MPKKITLTNFDLRARAEVPRLVLHAAKQPFEDVRITFEQWPALKPTTPFGSLPVLTVDGKQYAQANALTIFLAREFKPDLLGSDTLEELQILSFLMFREDLMIEEMKWFFDQDPTSKEEKRKTLLESYDRIFAKLTDLVEQNSKISKYHSVGKKLTLADIVVYEGTQTCSQHTPEILAKFPVLGAIRTTVESDPGIKKYLATRSSYGI